METSINERIRNKIKVLIDNCPKSMILNDMPLIKKAFDYACQNIGNTTWENDELILVHSISVAQIAVIELGLSIDSLIAALLHNVFRPDGVIFSPEEVKIQFGTSVAEILDGNSKN